MDRRAYKIESFQLIRYAVYLHSIEMRMNGTEVALNHSFITRTTIEFDLNVFHFPQFLFDVVRFLSFRTENHSSTINHVLKKK